MAVFRQMTARSCAESSFNVRYTWPEPARVQFEISPTTYASGKLPSTASLICRVSCVTVRTGGGGMKGDRNVTASQSCGVQELKSSRVESSTRGEAHFAILRLRDPVLRHPDIRQILQCPRHVAGLVLSLRAHDGSP